MTSPGPTGFLAFGSLLALALRLLKSYSSGQL